MISSWLGGGGNALPTAVAPLEERIAKLERQNLDQARLIAEQQQQNNILAWRNEELNQQPTMVNDLEKLLLEQQAGTYKIQEQHVKLQQIYDALQTAHVELEAEAERLRVDAATATAAAATAEAAKAKAKVPPALEGQENAAPSPPAPTTKSAIRALATPLSRSSAANASGTPHARTPSGTPAGARTTARIYGTPAGCTPSRVKLDRLGTMMSELQQQLQKQGREQRTRAQSPSRLMALERRARRQSEAFTSQLSEKTEEAAKLKLERDQCKELAQDLFEKLKVAQAETEQATEEAERLREEVAASEAARGEAVEEAVEEARQDTLQQCNEHYMPMLECKTVELNKWQRATEHMAAAAQSEAGDGCVTAEEAQLAMTVLQVALRVVTDVEHNVCDESAEHESPGHGAEQGQREQEVPDGAEGGSLDASRLSPRAV
eukprot:g6633.t1